MRPLRYLPRRSEDQKKQAKRAAHRRWVERNREAHLARKRQRAARPEVLEQRRIRYMHRNDPKPVPPKRLTLDDFARICSPRKDAFDSVGCNERNALGAFLGTGAGASVAPTLAPDSGVSL